MIILGPSCFGGAEATSFLLFRFLQKAIASVTRMLTVIEHRVNTRSALKTVQNIGVSFTLIFSRVNFLGQNGIPGLSDEFLDPCDDGASLLKTICPNKICYGAAFLLVPTRCSQSLDLVDENPCLAFPAGGCFLGYHSVLTSWEGKQKPVSRRRRPCRRWLSRAPPDPVAPEPFQPERASERARSAPLSNQGAHPFRIRRYPSR